MADGVHNISKGKINEYHDRVDSNDPANAVLVIYLLQVAEADATLDDYDDLGALIGAAGNTEATFTNYARIILDDTDITPSVVDDTNNRREADFADQTWAAAGGATNNSLVKLGVAYDSDSATGTDANIVPMSHHDFVITTNGGDVTAQPAATGYIRAS